MPGRGDPDRAGAESDLTWASATHASPPTSADRPIGLAWVPGRYATVDVAAIVGSLLADAIVVAIGEAAFPSTKGYAHSNSATTRR